MERLLFSFAVDGYGRSKGVISDLRRRTLTLLRAFAVRCCAIFLSLNKEMAKENQPKAAAFGNCFRAALQGGQRRKTYLI